MLPSRNYRICVVDWAFKLCSSPKQLQGSQRLLQKLLAWQSFAAGQGRKPAEMLSLMWLPGRWPVLCNPAGNSKASRESVRWGGLDWHTEFIKQLCFGEIERKLYRKGHSSSVLRQVRYQVIPKSFRGLTSRTKTKAWPMLQQRKKSLKWGVCISIF